MDKDKLKNKWVRGFSAGESGIDEKSAIKSDDEKKFVESICNAYCINVDEANLYFYLLTLSVGDKVYNTSNKAIWRRAKVLKKLKLVKIKKQEDSSYDIFSI